MQFYKDDDGGYTVVYDDGDVVAMNSRPNHPQHGVNQYVGNMQTGPALDVESFGEKIDRSQAPSAVVEAAEARLE